MDKDRTLLASMLIIMSMCIALLGIRSCNHHNTATDSEISEQLSEEHPDWSDDQIEDAMFGYDVQYLKNGELYTETYRTIEQADSAKRALINKGYKVY